MAIGLTITHQPRGEGISLACKQDWIAKDGRTYHGVLLTLDPDGSNLGWPMMTVDDLDRLAESLEGAAATLRAYVDALPAESTGSVEIGMDWAGKAAMS